MDGATNLRQFTSLTLLCKLIISFRSSTLLNGKLFCKLILKYDIENYLRQFTKTNSFVQVTYNKHRLRNAIRYLASKGKYIY